MADSAIPMVPVAAASVPSSFTTIVTVTNAAGVDGFWVNNDTDGSIEFQFSNSGVSNAIVLDGEAQEWQRLIPGTVIKYRYLAGAQPTVRSVYMGGFN